MNIPYEPIRKFSAERAETLAQLIESQPHTNLDDEAGFNMRSVSHHCGSPSCIAGWAGLLLGIPTCRIATIKAASVISDFLRCDLAEAKWLYYGDFAYQQNLWEITPSQAAAAIRQLASEYWQKNT
jgi:hypothetical protein